MAALRIRPAPQHLALAGVVGFAALLAGRVQESGRELAPRGQTTLVSFSSADAAEERVRLAREGIVVRNIPGRPWLRASVGAWNDENDLDRLLRALAN